MLKLLVSVVLILILLFNGINGQYLINMVLGVVFQLTIMLMTRIDLNTRSDRNLDMKSLCCFHDATVTGNDSILALLQIGQFSIVVGPLLFIKQVAHQKQVSHNRKCAW